MAVYRSSCEQDTFELGKGFAKNAYPGQIITLDGDLGAGKTVFAKGFAAGLGITKSVTSPTFTIIQEYRAGSLPLYHFDVYRIESPDEMYETGLDEYLFGDGVCIIEWADNIREILPDNIVKITISRADDDGPQCRIIEVESNAKRQTN